MARPKCRRCGASLDLWWEPPDGGDPGFWTFDCNGPKGWMTDADFQKAWDNLPGDDVVRLERQLTQGDSVSWAAIIALLLEFFGPALKKWLDDLFNRFAMPGNPRDIDPSPGMRALFQKARAETWWFQFGARAKLAICERIAVKRAPEFWSACKDGLAAPRMHPSEKKELGL